MTLKKMRPQRKRKAIKHREERFHATAPNQAWSIDFVADQLQDGRRFRALTVVDIFTREGVAIEVGQSLKGDDIVSVAVNEPMISALFFITFSFWFVEAALCS